MKSWLKFPPKFLLKPRADCPSKDVQLELDA